MVHRCVSAILSSHIFVSSLCQPAQVEFFGWLNTVEPEEQHMILLQFGLQLTRSSALEGHIMNTTHFAHWSSDLELLLISPYHNVYHIHNVHTHLKTTHLSPFAGVLASMVSMFLLGIDDVVWLLPFLCGQDKWRNTGFYLLFMQLVVVLSCATNTVMGAISVEHPNWLIRRDFQTFSCVILTLLALYLFWDWMYAETGETTSADDLDAFLVNVSTAHGAAQRAQEESEASASNETDKLSANVHAVYSAQRHQELGLWLLFAISMLASMDGYSVFTYIMFTEHVTPIEFSLGVFFGSCLIVALAHVALALNVVARIVMKVPLWLVFGAMAVYSYRGLLLRASVK